MEKYATAAKNIPIKHDGISSPLNQHTEIIVIHATTSTMDGNNKEISAANHHFIDMNKSEQELVDTKDDVNKNSSRIFISNPLFENNINVNSSRLNNRKSVYMS